MTDDVMLATCPACGDEDAHLVLKASPNSSTVQCQECGHVHSVSPGNLKLVQVQLVLSDGERSWTDTIQTPVGEDIAIADEFELESHRFIVTGIEQREGAKAVPKCVAEGVNHVYAKMFDTVPVKFAVNEGRVTKSGVIRMDPDDRLSIGQVVDLDGQAVQIKTLKSARNKMVRRGSLPARDIRRAFCDPA